MENDFYLCIYIIYYIRSKRKNGMARNRYTGVMKCARIVFGAIIAFRLISLASYDAASYNCTFNGAIIDSRETKRRRGERRRRELRAIRIVVVRDYLCDTSNLKRF